MRETQKPYIRPVPMPRDEAATTPDYSLEGPALSRYRLSPTPTDARGFWDSLALALACAGAVYPLLVVTCGWAIALPLLLMQALSGNLFPLAEAAPVLFLSAIFVVIGLVLGFAYVGIVSAVVLLPMASTFKLLGWNPKRTWQGLFCGGLVGWVCWLPFLLTIPSVFDPSFVSEALVSFILGPALAICCGQATGAYVGATVEYDEALRGEAPNARRISFSIKQMLALTLVASFGLSILKILGLLTASLVIAVVFWLAWQTLMWWPMRWLGTRFHRGRVRRIELVRTNWKQRQTSADPGPSANTPATTSQP